MIVVPADTPVTVPETTDAMEVLPLLHAPPPVASASVVVAASHITAVPVIGATAALTVTTAVALQPVPSE
jgi:hypothetical protein